MLRVGQTRPCLVHLRERSVTLIVCDSLVVGFLRLEDRVNPRDDDAVGRGRHGAERPDARAGSCSRRGDPRKRAYSYCSDGNESRSNGEGDSLHRVDRAGCTVSREGDVVERCNAVTSIDVDDDCLVTEIFDLSTQRRYGSMRGSGIDVHVEVGIDSIDLALERPQSSLCRCDVAVDRDGRTHLVRNALDVAQPGDGTIDVSLNLNDRFVLDALELCTDASQFGTKTRCVDVRIDREVESVDRG